ncbi:transcriptional regulator, DeoR family [Selenomonas ruminantium]|uniref:Lactose phosphotransferase system repressor n=1 Tax=Selenomonas ruminantium TaxID=971 RepID=A0A1M6R114_SELRU|nr:DeoR/GlpR family DNA-binding transcription regulator [Selenomonas ruminantium]SHK26175.1 transcriptional regulator, DeoR family [Selenomonas ruminantium]
MHIRHSKLLSLVNQHNRIAVTELARALDVSEVTIRKDLNILEKKGLLRREHGYARLTTSDDVGNHLSFNYEAKLRIARRAAESVHNGETIMIESGSCCALLAEEIAANRRDVTIITNSAFIADYIRKYNQVRVILLGGEYQKESQVMVGPMIRSCVRDFYVSKFFVGTDGLNELGFMSNDLMRAEAARSMAERAEQTIVLTESSKFKTHGTVKLLPFDKVSALYTDDLASNDIITQLHAQGIHIYPVGTP